MFKLVKTTKKLSKNLKKNYNTAPKFSFETLDKKKYVEKESEVAPQVENVSKEQATKQRKRDKFILETEKKTENILDKYLFPKLPETDEDKINYLEYTTQKQQLEEFQSELSKEEKLLYQTLDDDIPEPSFKEFDPTDLTKLYENIEQVEKFQRENNRKIPQHLTRTSVQDRLNGRILTELFNSYDIIEQKSSLDKTNWKYGTENFEELSNLKKMNDLKYDNNINRVQFSNSKNYKKSEYLERGKDFYTNDIVSTIQFYNEIKKFNFLNQDKYSKYRSLYNSIVQFLFKLENEKEIENLLNFEVVNEQKEKIEKSSLNSFLQNLSNDFKVTLNQTKEEEIEKKEQEQIEFEYFLDKFDSEELNEEELNILLLKKTFGTNSKLEIKNKLNLILFDLIELFEKYEILIFDIELLQDSMKLIPKENEKILSKLNKIINENKKEIELRENPKVLPKYLHTYFAK
eukprot:gene2179-2043_t